MGNTCPAPHISRRFARQIVYRVKLRKNRRTVIVLPPESTIESSVSRDFFLLRHYDKKNGDYKTFSFAFIILREKTSY